MVEHGLPEEDGLVAAAPWPSPLPAGKDRGEGKAATAIAIVAYPRISNHDEFQPLFALPGVHVRWARQPAELAGADWIVLPGSKHTSSDLAWLRAQRLAPAIAAHAQRGGTVLGICGGLQMLGEALVDPHGIDGNGPGLGLLPLVTVFAAGKTVRRTQACFAGLRGEWAALSGLAVSGYEIRHGQTAQHAGMAPAHVAMRGALGWQNAEGNVLGLYLHGLFEDSGVLRALFGSPGRDLDAVFEGLADFIDARFEPAVLDGLLA